MIKIKQTIVVEGKYDKIKLSQLVDTIIIDVCGFNIFKDKEKLNLIKKLADKNGILILTDSDHAGFMIRNYLNGVIPKEKIINAYIPDIFGKEKRKRNSSREGKLGVEGIPNDILISIIEKSVRSKKDENKGKSKKIITKIDFFNDGLTGKDNSFSKRKALLKLLNLPENLSQNALLRVLNEIISYDEYLNILRNLD